jgi:hypothetical protein
VSRVASTVTSRKAESATVTVSGLGPLDVADLALLVLTPPALQNWRHPIPASRVPVAAAIGFILSGGSERHYRDDPAPADIVRSPPAVVVFRRAAGRLRFRFGAAVVCCCATGWLAVAFVVADDAVPVGLPFGTISQLQRPSDQPMKLNNPWGL